MPGLGWVHASVAQLVEAPVSETGCCRFESCAAHDCGCGPIGHDAWLPPRTCGFESRQPHHSCTATVNLCGLVVQLARMPHAQCCDAGLQPAETTADDLVV